MKTKLPSRNSLPAVTLSESKIKKSAQQSEATIKGASFEAVKSLDDLRRIFVEKGPGAMRELSCSFDGSLAQLLRVLSELPFVTLGSERPQDSLQEGLMALIKKSGARNIETQYAAALKSARGAFFDLVTGNVRSFLTSEACLSKALWRALLIQDSTLLCRSKGAFKYVVDGMRRHGFDFLIDLVDDCRVRRKDKNSSDDKTSEGAANSSRLNDLKWVMAANWTNPDLPLWLMQAPALVAACRLLSPASPWTTDAVNKTIKRGKFTRRGRGNPIKEVRNATLGSKRGTLVLKGNEFSALNGKLYHVRFVRPLAQLEDSEVISKAIKFEADNHKLKDMVKTPGEESAEYKHVWSELSSHFDLTLVETSGYRIEVQTK